MRTFKIKYDATFLKVEVIYIRAHLRRDFLW